MFGAKTNLQKGASTKPAVSDGDSPAVSKGASPAAGKGISPTVSEGTDQAIRSSTGKGSPMDGATQSFLSKRMEHDFSDVRIHADANAHQLSDELGARAFTVGRDIYFNEGEYQPGSNEGRRLLAHELTHTIQQVGGQGTVRKKDKTDEPVYPPTLEESARKDLLDALHKGDAPIFLSRLRSWYPYKTEDLLNDASFMKEIRSTFRGSAFWSVFTILFFPTYGSQRRPIMTLPQRQLSAALFEKNITGAMDALVTIMVGENIEEDIYWNVLKEVVVSVFAGDPKLQDMIRMIVSWRTRFSGPIPLSFTGNEVHYEKVDGADTLVPFGASAKAISYFTATDLRVVVTVRLVNGDDPKKPAFEGEAAGIPDKWASHIRSVWNNKFELSNGIDTKQFTVAPVFTSEEGREDATIMVHHDETAKCPGPVGRGNSNCWIVHDKDPDKDLDMVAHEFGHLLGAVDEYNLPDTLAEIPATLLATLAPLATPTNLSLTTLSGLKGLDKSLGEVDTTSCDGFKGNCVKGLMGDLEHQLYGRNILLLVAALNANLPSGVPPYDIKKK